MNMHIYDHIYATHTHTQIQKENMYLYHGYKLATFPTVRTWETGGQEHITFNHRDRIKGPESRMCT